MQGMGSSRLLLHNGQRVLLSQLEVESPFQTGAAAGLGAAVEQLGAEGHSLDDAVAVRVHTRPAAPVLAMQNRVSRTIRTTMCRLPVPQTLHAAPST
jgi:hypothetical protein